MTPRNPILEAFRQYDGVASEWLQASDGWWNNTAFFNGASAEDIAHARRVLRRLAVDAEAR